MKLVLFKNFTLSNQNESTFTFIQCRHSQTAIVCQCRNARCWPNEILFSVNMENGFGKFIERRAAEVAEI